MDIIKKSDKIKNISINWDKVYKGTNCKNHIQIGERLKSEHPKTEQDIENIIGNRSWTKNICDECKKDSDINILFEHEPYEIYVCLDCLKKAINLIEKNIN